MPVRMGQVYATTHKQDVANGVRQRRVVTFYDGGDFVWIKTEGARNGATRVRLRNGRIPGHRLVEDVAA
jgi:hypothetical protein